MKCPKCGAQNTDRNGAFCSRCGTQLEQPPVVSQDLKTAKQQAWKRNISFLFKFFGGYLALALIAALILLLTNNGISNNQTGSPMLLIDILTQIGAIVFVAMVIPGMPIFVILYLVIITSLCESCGSFFAKREDKSKLQDLGFKYGYETRTDSHNIKNKDGEVIGSTSIDRQVRVKVSSTKHVFFCRYCGHEWSQVEQKSTDRFTE